MRYEHFPRRCVMRKWSWTALVALPLEWALLTWGAVLPEERYLASKFGASYADYTRRVRRWL